MVVSPYAVSMVCICLVISLTSGEDQYLADVVAEVFDVLAQCVHIVGQALDLTAEVVEFVLVVEFCRDELVPRLAAAFLAVAVLSTTLLYTSGLVVSTIGLNQRFLSVVYEVLGLVDGDADALLRHRHVLGV
jgi:hypothetical protein